ncbi:hypothetical protein Pcinc_011025 [Petrolisthes cinctipes]|uniref:Uncharacterized protein n=1 Tax=Petrolisthes cinctipes TaxID=88211 RepID=A0AAE1KT02_PETCI|nr:hypothetical protein Pcinc_014553 [Petrolisthes cinctipes]KAK3884706.1 hypothetical protein Pcinc_011025 [Petrolisthes cinctipes]
MFPGGALPTDGSMGTLTVGASACAFTAMSIKVALFTALGANLRCSACFSFMPIFIAFMALNDIEPLVQLTVMRGDEDGEGLNPIGEEFIGLLRRGTPNLQ